jgi:hypothetical protein
MVVPLFLAGLVAAIAGPLLATILVVRGLREGHPSWLALGALCGIPWVLLVVAALRRGLRSRRPG